MFIASLFTIAKTWKQSKYPLIEGWIKKSWCIYTMEYYSAIKNEWNNVIRRNMMDLEIVILNEVHQTQKGKYHMKSLIFEIQQEIMQMNLQTRKWFTELENELMVAGGRMGGRDREFGMDLCTLLYLKMDNQQGPLVYHRKLYLMLCDSLDGRGVWGRMEKCMYMAESFHCQLKLSQYC